MSELGSALTSAFTPPGATAASNEQQRQGQVGSDASKILDDLFPSLGQEANYAGSLEPEREQDINRALMLTSPGNAQARTSLFNASANANAAQAQKQAALADQAGGLSPSFESGQNQAISNAAAQAENAYQQQQLSPQQSLANANSALGAVASGMAMPELPTLSGLGGLIYGQPKVQVGQGLGGVLGGLAGDYLGGLGGGGGGGSSGGNDDSGGTPDYVSSMGNPTGVQGPSYPPVGGNLGFGEGVGAQGAGY